MNGKISNRLALAAMRFHAPIRLNAPIVSTKPKFVFVGAHFLLGFPRSSKSHMK